MDFQNLIFGGALLGILAACWDQIKSVCWRFANLFIRRVEVPSESAHQALISYLIANYKKYPLFVETWLNGG